MLTVRRGRGLDAGVAQRRMFAISGISTMKVDWPEARSSEAPTLVNILSTTPMEASRAGTKDPSWAINTMRAVCLI